MKIKLLITLLISVLILSCKKDDSGTKTKFLAKITTSGTSHSKRVFNYDESDRMISIEWLDITTDVPIKKYEFTYKNGKLFTMDGMSQYEKYEFTYYEDSIVMNLIYTNSDKSYLRTIFYYNKNNVIDSVNFWASGSKYRMILDENNNILDYGICDRTMCISGLEYDNQRNIYSSIPLLYRIINRMDIGENNKIYCKQGNYNYSYEYEYDSESYPSQCISRRDPLDPNDTYSTTAIDTLLFEYK